MAIAKTPKKTTAALPAAVKPIEDAVVHSAEIVSEQSDEITDAAEHAAQAANSASAEAADVVAAEAEKAADTVSQIAEKPSRAVTVVAEAAQDAGDSVLKTVSPFLDFGRDHAILMVATGNQLALGLHKMSLSLIDWSAESCDKGVAAGRAMLSAKTVEDVIDLSHALAKAGLDQFLKESSELGALSSRLIEDAIVPLPGRVAAAVERLASRAA